MEAFVIVYAHSVDDRGFVEGWRRRKEEELEQVWVSGDGEDEV